MKNICFFCRKIRNIKTLPDPSKPCDFCSGKVNERHKRLKREWARRNYTPHPKPKIQKRERPRCKECGHLLKTPDDFDEHPHDYEIIESILNGTYEYSVFTDIPKQ